MKNIGKIKKLFLNKDIHSLIKLKVCFISVSKRRFMMNTKTKAIRQCF